jgi:hypothetical protein
MYAPYVRDGASVRRHAPILDAEIVYGHWVDRLPRVWWFGSLFIAACGIAGWLVTLPLN